MRIRAHGAPRTPRCLSFDADELSHLPTQFFLSRATLLESTRAKIRNVLPWDRASSITDLLERPSSSFSQSGRPPNRAFFGGSERAMQRCRRAAVLLASSGSTVWPAAAEAAGAAVHSAGAAYQRCSQLQLHHLSQIHRELAHQGKRPSMQFRRFSEGEKPGGGGDESGVARFWR